MVNKKSKICKKQKYTCSWRVLGSGKTRFFVKPNLMQMHSSYVVTDPRNDSPWCGKMLEKNGYDIKILNTINFKRV